MASNTKTTRPVSSIPWRDRPVLRFEDVAVLLGGVSRSNLYRMQAAGKLLFVKIGGRTVVKTSSVIEYLDALEVIPAGELADRCSKTDAMIESRRRKT